MTAPEMLRQAAALIEQHTHGRDCDGETSLALAARLFSEWRGVEFTERDACVFVALLKLSRAAHGSNPDNWLDGAAYVAMAGAAEIRTNGDTSSRPYLPITAQAYAGLYQDLPSYIKPDCEE